MYIDISYDISYLEPGIRGTPFGVQLRFGDKVLEISIGYLFLHGVGYRTRMEFDTISIGKNTAVVVDVYDFDI